MTPEQLAEIHAACFTSPRPWSVQEFTDILQNSRTKIFTCSNGFLIAQTAGPEVEILTLAIRPDARRQGLAKSLLSDLIIWGKKIETEQIFLEVSENNAAAIALYHAAGFTESGHRKDYYTSSKGPKINALILSAMVNAN